MRLHALNHTSTAQPDRPEPVDPENVRVGDVVEIADTGEVAYTFSGGLALRGTDGDPIYYSITEQTTVRVLHRAEPEPDPEAVEELTAILDSDPLSVAGTADDVREMARRLIRRGVEVPTDG